MKNYKLPFVVEIAPPKFVGAVATIPQQGVAHVFPEAGKAPSVPLAPRHTPPKPAMPKMLLGQRTLGVVLDDYSFAKGDEAPMATKRGHKPRARKSE